MRLFWQKLKFPLISFIAGYALMAIELISTRIVAPFLGLSVYTWTSVIGITLLGLSLGNFIGGFLADKTNARKTLVYCLLAAALLTIIIPALKILIPGIIFSPATLIVKILIVSSSLFLLPAIFLGTIYPLLLKLYSGDLETIGKKTGLLSASWALGSILGTFLTGYYFIGTLGSAKTLYVLGLSLIFAAIISNVSLSKKNWLILLLFGGLLPILLTSVEQTNNRASSNKLFESESNYYKIQVIDDQIFPLGKSRFLFLDFDSHSIEGLEGQKLKIYTEIHPIFKIFSAKGGSATGGKDEISKIYTIGGGAYTLAKNLADEYPNSEIIVSEIDPEVTLAAKEFFGLKNYLQIKTVFEDGRVYLTRDSKKYDLIFGDAYNSFISVPWHLTTFEFNELVKNRLTPGGIYAINFISSITGENSYFFKSMLKTFRLSFPNSYIFAYGKNEYEPQNIVLAGLNSSQKISENYIHDQMSKIDPKEKFLPNYKADLIIDESAVVLTDNFAPVEKLMLPLVNNYFPMFAKTYYPLLYP